MMISVLILGAEAFSKKVLLASLAKLGIGSNLLVPPVILVYRVMNELVKRKGGNEV